ncbi:MAG TPA: transposase [Clostridiales bacterium]|nr:transposase [Clostridiales bacterium]
MARKERKKSPEYTYHVMTRSITEIDLFRCDEDKDYYLNLLKRYKEKYHCSIYSYILMNNHTHVYINPCGADISTFMLCLNTAYVSYYNKRYKRRGHLFQDRFASTVVDNNTYSFKLTAYINNNAKDLPGYRGKEELYPYSSYGIYTGFREDYYELVDTEFLLKQFSIDKNIARERYRAFTESMKDTDAAKEVDENIMRAYTENVYRSEKSYIVRTEEPDKILVKIGQILGENLTEGLRLKHSRENSKNRAFVTYILRTLCGYTYKQLCKYIGNMSMSGVSRLSNEGFRIFKEQVIYRNAFSALIRTT